MMPYKDIVKEITILLGVALITAFIVNAISPKGIAIVGEWDPAKGVISAKSKGDKVNRELEIKDPSEAKKIFDKGKSIFVDARSREDYEDGHIKGAVFFPVYDYESYIDTFLNNYPLATSIITYCSGRECDDSHELAQILSDMGYTEIRVFIDGFPTWEEKGFPIE